MTTENGAVAPVRFPLKSNADCRAARAEVEYLEQNDAALIRRAELMAELAKLENEPGVRRKAELWEAILEFGNSHWGKPVPVFDPDNLGQSPTERDPVWLAKYSE